MTRIQSQNIPFRDVGYRLHKEQAACLQANMLRVADFRRWNERHKSLVEAELFLDSRTSTVPYVPPVCPMLGLCNSGLVWKHCTSYKFETELSHISSQKPQAVRLRVPFIS